MFRPRPLIAAALLSALTAGAMPAAAAESGDADVFQIMKATETQVWRLNKRTGEIAVCSLESGTNLVCVATTEVKAPKLSYAELEARRKATEEAEKKRREDERQKDLALIDRMIELFRQFLREMSAREKT